MSMLVDTHDVVFEDIRQRLSNVSGLDYNFRQRLATASKISLTITPTNISIDIDTVDRREGFNDSAKPE